MLPPLQDTERVGLARPDRLGIAPEFGQNIGHIVLIKLWVQRKMNHRQPAPAVKSRLAD